MKKPKTLEETRKKNEILKKRDSLRESKFNKYLKKEIGNLGKAPKSVAEIGVKEEEKKILKGSVAVIEVEDIEK